MAVSGAGANRRVPTIILCGGRGSRMEGEAQYLPKPMLTIGERPILWHIMKAYESHGFTDFVVALGHLAEKIKEFFLHFDALTRDFSIALGADHGLLYLDGGDACDWQVTCVDTGRDALTGTRVRRAADAVDGSTLMVTYGDGVGDVDIAAVLDFHRSHGKLATVTAVRPPGRFGELDVDPDGNVDTFSEKPQTSTGTINGGFMVFERAAIERYIPTDVDVMLEREPLAGLAADGQLKAFRHSGFWQPMDTPRERRLLNELWASGGAPWKTW